MTIIKMKFIALLIMFPCLCTALTGCSEGASARVDYWPTKGWKTSTPEAQGMDSQILNSMFKDIQSSGLEMHSILIIRNGYMVTEGYFYPYRKEYRHILNSVTKSITSGLVGIAVEDGYIKSIDQKIVDIFSDRNIQNLDENKMKITIKNLLMMTPGFDWQEAGSYNTSSDSNTQMLRSENQVDFVLNRPMAYEPGKTFYYNTGASHLLSSIIQKTSGKNLLDYANEKIFNHLGISDLSWRIDRQGNYSGGGGIFMKPEDLAKYGYLYLNKGKWAGKQLIPEKWVEESTKKQINTPNGLAGRYGYGYQWWQNKLGGFSGRGFSGQYLFVVPDENLVAVFTAGLESRDFYRPEELMEEYILPSIKSSKAMEESPKSSEELNNTLKNISREPDAVQPKELPGTAKKISGKIYTMDNGETYSFEFTDGNECSMHWFSDGIMYDVKIGLDNIYRSSDMKEFYWKNMTSKAGFRGEWSSNNTFVVDLRPLEDSNRYTMEFTFDGNSLHAVMTALVGNIEVTNTSGVYEE